MNLSVRIRENYFTQQLYPSLQTNLSNFVNLTLVPYGKTKASFEMSEYKFECHHGPAECRGNKIQACALKLIEADPNSAGLGFNRVATGFINCLMDKAVRNGDDATFPTNDCAVVNRVSNLNHIENCANHVDGSNQLALFGKITDDLQKPLKGVPTIVFNDVYKAEDNSLAQSNFVKALCQYIVGAKPEECSKNGAGSLSISLACLVLALVFSRSF
uniref:Gamma-interferon-inducible-lysosomal thiol reductase n=1 Tax=Anoplophora glabripennis TaxID=217634 RepID=V5G552_ANOGL